MGRNINEEEWAEVFAWLRDHWGDDDFEIPLCHFKRPDFAGTYTRLCCIVTRGGKEFIFKLYHSDVKRQRGGWNEVANYDLYGPRHPVLPHLIAKLPRSAEERQNPFQAILISYHPYEFQPASLLEVLACVLNLATLFTYFSRDGRIYFDLKQDCLRLDEQGGLRLIDFTDLLAPAVLCMYSMGLPAPDYNYCPPEGRRYHEAAVRRQQGAPFRTLQTASEELRPEPYHCFNLARLVLFLLNGRDPADPGVRGRIAAAAADHEGAFTGDEQRKFLNLLEVMLSGEAAERPPLEEVRREFWALLKPRLDGGSSGAARRALRLLSTVTLDPQDTLAHELHDNLGIPWR